jgi:hypothetical protein
MIIPDPNFFHPESRTLIFFLNGSRIRRKEVKNWNQKNCVQALGNMIRVVHSGPGSWFFTHPGSRIQGSKRRQIPDPDPQHCRRLIQLCELQRNSVEKYQWVKCAPLPWHLHLRVRLLRWRFVCSSSWISNPRLEWDWGDNASSYFWSLPVLGCGHMEPFVSGTISCIFIVINKFWHIFGVK